MSARRAAARRHAADTPVSAVRCPVLGARAYREAMADQGYGEAERTRWAPEPPSTGGSVRTAFERDRARVLHSAAFRRLAGKTQVVAPGESDFPRTRLTHSLECAQIGRELGAAFGADPDIVDAACLAHDLGHPPFGHTGEHALDLLTRPYGGFEGNAQSLRVLTRLEAKILAPATAAEGPRSVGLNLTRAVLDAATKYPWRREDAPAVGDAPKFGVYEDDLPVFTWFRGDAPPRRLCFEAQVMDWADDVAYSVHDLEDAIHAGHLNPRLLRDRGERAELFDLARSRYVHDADPAELAEALDRMQALGCWPDGYDRSFAAQTELKRTTSELIGRFCLAAIASTRAAYPIGRLRRYDAELLVPTGVRLECAVLKSVAARYVMDRAEARRLRSRQRDLVTETVARLLERPDAMEPPFAAVHRAANSDAERLRVVVDQVASLTDASVSGLHRALTAPGARARR